MNNSDRIPLEIRHESLNNILTEFYYDIPSNSVNITVNHKYQLKTIEIPTTIIINQDRGWYKFIDLVSKSLREIAKVNDEQDIQEIGYALDDNHDLIYRYNSSSKNNNTGNEKNENKKSKRNITTFKYSQMGKGDLYETVFIADGLPVFIKYNDQLNELETIEKIEETTRILVPPTVEECPYIRYEFESLDEINSINKVIEDNHIGLDYLFYTGYEIVSKYNNQSKDKLRLVTIKIITSHFQDRFSTTEYLYPVGGNGSGKSSLAETFRALAYRAVVMTDPTAPNLFRLLGVVEPVQCTMILEEADKIDKSPELMAVLKTGYSWYGMVPKINLYTLKQEFFYAYCPKIIVSERSLNQSIANGVNSRTFPITCIKGSTKHDIKEVLNPTNTGGTENKKLFKEIMNFRKLLLVYRLRHFKDSIPDLHIGVEGRDKELVKHSVQLFNGCKCLTEVIETLQKFLDIKNEKKESSIESVLLKVVETLLKFNGPKISSKSIRNELMQEIPGILNEKNPNEYHTDDYGTIYRTSTLSSYLGDSFGGVVKHRKKGNDWIFDPEIIQRLAQEDKTRIIIKNIDEGVNTVKAPGEGGSTSTEILEEEIRPNNTLEQNYAKVENEEVKEGEVDIVNNNDTTTILESQGLRQYENVEKSNTSSTYMPSQPSPIHPSSPDNNNKNNNKEKKISKMDTIMITTMLLLL